jgi:hypothetical protein
MEILSALNPHTWIAARAAKIKQEHPNIEAYVLPAAPPSLINRTATLLLNFFSFGLYSHYHALRSLEEAVPRSLEAAADQANPIGQDQQLWDVETNPLFEALANFEPDRVRQLREWGPTELVFEGHYPEEFVDALLKSNHIDEGAAQKLKEALTAGKRRKDIGLGLTGAIKNGDAEALATLLAEDLYMPEARRKQLIQFIGLCARHKMYRENTAKTFQSLMRLLSR